MKQKMKIVVLNPNSSEEMTHAIARSARKYAQNRFEVLAITDNGAPEFIDYPEDVAKATKDMMQIIKDHEYIADAFVIACHCDPNVKLLRQISKKPVIGIGEASMRLAAMLGARFSVITTDLHSVTQKYELIHEYGLERYCASVRVRDKSIEDEMEAYEQAARKAIEEDLAEVIVLGCAGLCEMAEELTKRLKVPVLDGVVCGLILAEGMVNAGYRTSKVRFYAGKNDL
ncbi:MAG: aspartate/glutamate racemase family protein [Lachnospiraceae bacterium]|nr:aspartate/glutamate racemase family protein [Lachnospiraceae bacterium]